MLISNRNKKRRKIKNREGIDKICTRYKKMSVRKCYYRFGKEFERERVIAACYVK